MAIRCGNRDAHTETTYHQTVEGVRACHRDETWACGWLVSIPAGYAPEIENWVDARIVPCGALAWRLPDGRGYTCEAGHEHIYCEVRDAERWDYVDGPEEARRLAALGVAALGMDGRPVLV